MSDYNFLPKLGRTINTGQSKAIILSGNIYDLFWSGEKYVPLGEYIHEKCKQENLLQINYELNGPVRFLNGCRPVIKSQWVRWRSGVSGDESLSSEEAADLRSNANNEFEKYCQEATSNHGIGLNFLRTLCQCSREILHQNLFITIEGADMLLPAGPNIASLSMEDRNRIGVVQDWFCDPAFNDGQDCVILVAESQSLIHSRISKLPQVISLQIGSPTEEDRYQFLEWFYKSPQYTSLKNKYGFEKPEQDDREVARMSAALSLQALRQMALGAKDKPINSDTIIHKVEEYIKTQLGEEVVEFKRPNHTMEDIIGNANLKDFLKREFIPRILESDPDCALPGAAVGGSIGSGKTFIFEAVAAELGIPVLVLKNIRSKWFGETDVIFERLKRVLESIVLSPDGKNTGKILIFADEADTLFGRISGDAHETEKRLTGKIQSMQSDQRLKGGVIWLLMTARINLLSPDIRRPGRVGNLIIPVLDPEGKDRQEFIEWTLDGLVKENNNEQWTYDDACSALRDCSEDYSAAAFAALRSDLRAAKCKNWLDVMNLIKDIIPSDIGDTRKYQELQALINCTRKSLYPKYTKGKKISELREIWRRQIKELEAEGIS